jgi:hypothetical protein
MSNMMNVAYTGESDFVWRYGNAFTRTDIRTTGSDSHRDYIRRWFERRASEVGADTVVDKTLHNVLRLPWVKQVFPDAKFIHLIRDGRAVALSSAREWHGFSSDSLDSKTFRSKGKFAMLRDVTSRKGRYSDRVNNFRSFVEMFADTRKAVRVYGNIMGLPTGSTWGVRVPGLADVAREYSPLVASAFQWDFCTRAGLLFTKKHPEMVYQLHYEALRENPIRETKRLINFFELSEPLQHFFDDFDTPTSQHSINNFDRFDDSDYAIVNEYLRPTLIHLGYTG